MNLLETERNAFAIKLLFSLFGRGFIPAPNFFVNEDLGVLKSDEVLKVDNVVKRSNTPPTNAGVPVL
ncbi:hypothetical protein [Haloquadratum walsbyi]|jgi:hypothetical protein|uniref:Uncharacterized protein n=1 Tax=Haloquadratum walsbyi J07HQW2 TaxID=1238425 RepID=U1PNT7_9EURY|nr:hypothetical protein [Haloquadratum walsbyi]ERG93931.1 MAG: hypothetical protein J07HQW2_00365 [Haloquadratum walsbyi J07HQW2]